MKRRKLKKKKKRNRNGRSCFCFFVFFWGGGLVLSIIRGECFNDRQWNSKSIARTTVSFSFHHLHIQNYLFCYHFLVGYAHWNLNMKREKSLIFCQDPTETCISTIRNSTEEDRRHLYNATQYRYLELIGNYLFQLCGVVDVVCSVNM